MAYRRADNVVFEDSGDRAVLLDGAGTTLFTLNPVGGMVWHALDGTAEPMDIAIALLPHLEGVSVEVLTADVSSFLSELAAEGLVE